MRHLTYLGVLAACLACALWLEPVLRVGVLRRWRRLLLTLAPVVAVFVVWDVVAIAAGQWSYDPGQLVGITLPGRLREAVGIEKDVVVLGVRDRMEIWDRATYERYEATFAGAYQAGTLQPRA